MNPGNVPESAFDRTRRTDPWGLWEYVINHFPLELSEVERGAVRRIQVQAKTPSGRGLEHRFKAFDADSP